MEPMTAMVSTKASVLSLALTLMLTLTMAAEILLTLTLMGHVCRNCVGVGLSCALREEVTGVGEGTEEGQCPFLLGRAA